MQNKNIKHSGKQKHRVHIKANWQMTNSYLLFYQSQVHSLFDELIHKPWGYSRSQPRVDVLETENSFIIKIDLPGIDADGVNIEIQETTLIIHGTRETQPDEKVIRIHLRECPRGDFVRTFEFEEELNEERIEYSLENGVLTLVVTKVQDR
jgi:HSP20 family protein